MSVKQHLKNALRPFLPRFTRLVHVAMRPELTEIEEMHRQLDYAIPAVLNRISSQAASERGYMRSIADLYDRIEFVRRELLFELRYGAGDREQRESPPGRVVNEQKLADMKDKIRINLGAGHVALDGYLNVDSRDLEHIDVVASVGNLPFEPGSLQEIFSAHLLEHFPVEELQRVLLPYWVSLLQPGGTLVAVVPDMESMVAECAAGRMRFEDFREVTYGAQEYEGDFHFNGFSQESLSGLLSGAGLTEVSVREAGRRNGLCLEMEIEGSKPAPTSD